MITRGGKISNKPPLKKVKNKAPEGACFLYWNKRCLVMRTQITSIQPTKKPTNVTIKLMMSLSAPPFLKNVDQRTIISVIQFTPGMSSSMTCTRRLYLLNHVMT